MKKNILFTCLIMASLMSLPLLAQKKQEQKSKERYKAYKSSSATEASSLLKEAYALKETNPGEALNKVEDALGISIATKDIFNEGKCYLFIGEINESIQEWKLASDNFTVAYERLKEAPETPEFLKILKGLANTSAKLNQYTAAIKYYNEALNLKSSRSEVNHILLSIAEVEYEQGRSNEALKTLERIQFGKVSDADLEARVQNLKARILAKKNDLGNSSRVLDNSLNSLSSESTVSPSQAQSIKQTKEEISEGLRGQQRYGEDIDLRNKSIAFNSNVKNMEEVAKDKLAISKSFEDLGETSSARRELEEAVAIADSINDAASKAQAYLALATFYERDGENKRALLAYKKYSEAVNSTEKQIEAENEQREALIKKQREIESLSKEVSISQQQEKIEQTTVSRQKIVIYGLILIIVIIATTSYFIYKNAVASKIANQLLALKSLRSQMNPHFIFNALNSVNHFIAQQDERTANKFLSEFSQLMRLVLENSQEDFIPLQKEQEILSLYLKLEHYRFRDKFEYTIDIDETINTDVMEVPPMLIQPYIENAVWHGLRYKDAMGHLLLKVRQDNDALLVEIHDNGIGRKQSAALKTVNQKKHNSTGIKNIEERLKILNTVYKANYQVIIEDLPEGNGTIVKISIPVNHRKKSIV
jgi:tetratricopeptide (TPR) repeat protein